MEIRHYRLIATYLLQQDNPISIERLAVNIKLPIKEIEEVLKFFNQSGFLKHGSDYSKIQLNEKARVKDSN